jgi:hypothetical protein
MISATTFGNAWKLNILYEKGEGYFEKNSDR